MRLYVSTTDPWFRVQAFRLGYHRSQSGRLIWQSGKTTGKRQPACPVTTGINMVSCGSWSPSLTFMVTSAFMQGDYMIKLTGPGNRQARNVLYSAQSGVRGGRMRFNVKSSVLTCPGPCWPGTPGP